MALDVKQAQEVQQAILPEARLLLPELTIETEYRPAREVGSDFSQIILQKTDGRLLIAALLVDAIRSTSELNSDPAFVFSAPIAA